MKKKDKLKNNLLLALKNFYLEGKEELPPEFLFLSFNKVFKEKWKSLVGKKISIEEVLLSLVQKQLIDIDLSDLFYFRDLGILINFIFATDNFRFSNVVNKIIKEKITFDTIIKIDYMANKIILNKVNFINLSDIISPLYFENWQGEKSIEVGAYFVRLCDYLNIKIKKIDVTPDSWNIKEEEFDDYVCNSKTRNELKDFARLFSKPIKKWYRDKYWWEVDEVKAHLKVDEESKKIVKSIKSELMKITKKLDAIN